ncbi:MAG: Asp23/Gls24 family envelope stress response protein [Cellulomonas sp.]
MASSTWPTSWAPDVVAETALARSEPGERGDLEIAGRVVQNVAAKAAGEVDGVVSTGSGFDQLLGHRYPNADATVTRGRARIQIDLAVAWPYPLAQVTAQVRDHVRARVVELVGIAVDVVDVMVSQVVHAAPPEVRRVQ